jgi:MerR family transcriptional regulator, light-induced transcriptional regulator
MYTSWVREDASIPGTPEERRSIGEVVALLEREFPDVSPSSLRFLEREGLVKPHRTQGGHRQYDPQQIERVRRIKMWQRERLSLAEIRERLEAATRLAGPSEVSQAFLVAALAGDRYLARAAIMDAYETGMPLVDLFDSVLRPALYEIGQQWAAGNISVSQEHEVTALVRDILGELASRLPDVTEPHGVLVAACVPGELHDLGLRMTACQFQAQGYTVHFLGADVPVEAILHAVRVRRASVLLLSATQEHHLAALEATLRAIKTLPGEQRPRVLVGGQAVHHHIQVIAELGAEPVAQTGGSSSPTRAPDQSLDGTT